MFEMTLMQKKELIQTYQMVFMNLWNIERCGASVGDDFILIMN